MLSGKLKKKAPKNGNGNLRTAVFFDFFCPWLDYRGGSSDLYSMRKVMRSGERRQLLSLSS